MRPRDTTDAILQPIVTAVIAAVGFGIISQAVKYWRAGNRRVAWVWVGAAILYVPALGALAAVAESFS
jgi:hypothetical protein